MSDEGMELYKKYRPTRFSELVGQSDAVNVLTEMGRSKSIPHCILLSGPSGCGKTTIARILKDKLKCSDQDFVELNIADVRGIDTVRSIRDRMWLSPLGGDTRIWLLDEVARATTDAQNAFLKILEDTPTHVYFLLATTEPQRLLNTIRTRATEVKVKPLKPQDMGMLLNYVARKESFELNEEARDRIIELADGSPRKALVLLNQILHVDGEENQIAVLTASLAGAQAIDLARALVSPKVQWSNVAKILKELEDDPEAVRRLILGYASSILLNGGNMAGRAALLIDVFRDNLFDSGKAGLVRNCYEIVMGK